MSQFDNSDKTVADFDLEAFNKRMDEKDNKKNQKKADDDFDDDFDVKKTSSKKNDTDDIDSIDDDLLKEDSSILKKLSKIDKSSKSQKNDEEESSSRRKRNTEKSSSNKTQVDIEEIEEEAPQNNSDKTQILSLDQFEQPQNSIEVDIAKLKVVEGGNLEEFSIKKSPSTIGRTDNNDVIIANNTISRNHCKIEKTANGFVVSDLGSGNGIKVNGKKVPSKSLKTGDILGIGNLKLQFIDLSVEQYNEDSDDDVVPVKGKNRNNSAGKANSKKMLLIISVVIVILGLGGAVVFKKQQDKKKLEAIALQKQEQEKKDKQIAHFFKKGVEAYKDKEWNSAIDNFDNALKLKKDYKDAQNYKESSEKEKANFEMIEGSGKDLINEDFKGALLKLQKIPETSTYYASAQENIKIAQKKFKDYQLKIAQKNFDEGNNDTASKLVGEILEAHPDFEEALTLKAAIDEKLIAEKGDANKKNTTTVTKFDPSKHSNVKKTDNSKNKYNEGLKLYGAKQFSQASEFFLKINTPEAQEYSKNVKDVETLLDQGGKFLKLKDYSKGIPALTKASTLDAKLGGQLKGEINQKLSSLYSIGGQLLFGEKNYAQSYKYSSKGASLDSNNAEATKVLGLLSKKANEMYLDAYMREARDPEAAKTKYKEILNMISPNDALYEKVTKRLNK